MQVGAFAARERAERQVEELKRKGYTAVIVQ
ncbi:MAG: SPOR domain-containing protein [Bacillota bacterium]|nr:SPOR domain-containing protein [Bacillota bacterium]